MHTLMVRSPRRPPREIRSEMLALARTSVVLPFLKAPLASRFLPASIFSDLGLSDGNECQVFKTKKELFQGSYRSGFQVDSLDVLHTSQ